MGVDGLPHLVGRVLSSSSAESTPLRGRRIVIDGSNLFGFCFERKPFYPPPPGVRFQCDRCNKTRCFAAMRGNACSSGPDCTYCHCQEPFRAKPICVSPACLKPDCAHFRERVCRFGKSCRGCHCAAFRGVSFHGLQEASSVEW
jgi:hypothetical protein